MLLEVARAAAGAVAPSVGGGVGVEAAVAATSVGLDPGAALDAAGPVRAAAAFAVLLVAGSALVATRGRLVDRATDASAARPLAALVYGLLAHGLVAFLGGYGVTQLSRVAPSSPVATVGVALVGVAALALATLGFVVVGTALTDAAGARNPWTGVVVGASIGAAVGLVSPLVLGIAAWVVVTSAGIGGATREWVHADRSGTARS